jgi:hypothetical protein
MTLGKKELSQKLREEHAAWRKNNFESKKGFFPIFYGFEQFLPKLSGGAVSLFLYLGLHSNNKTGESYHNIETIANFFGKSPRTISSWFKELQNEGLIYRVQTEFNGVTRTFIRPYTQNKEDQEEENAND